MIIHFICRGNAHRTIMAQAYLNSLRIEDLTVLSSGTVADEGRQANIGPLRDTLQMLDDFGIRQHAKTQPEQLDQSRVDQADITILMNEIVRSECEKIVTLPENTIIWDIDDTSEGKRILQYGDPDNKYDKEIYQEIKSNVDSLIQRLGLVTSDRI